MTGKPKKLLGQVRDALCTTSYRMEQSSVDWIRSFILFHNKHHPAEMGEQDVQTFLSHLPAKERVRHPHRAGVTQL